MSAAGFVSAARLWAPPERAADAAPTYFPDDVPWKEEDGDLPA